MTALKSQAASGVMWMAFQMWFMRLTTVGAFIVLSRHLEPAEIGLVALGMAVIGVLGILSDSGLATYVIKIADLTPRVLATAFWTSMAIAGALAGILLLLASPTAALLREPQLAPVLQVLSIGVVLTGLNSVPTALLKRQMRFKSLAIRGTLATIIGSIVAIALAVSGAGVWALVVQSLVRNAIAVVFTWMASRWFPSERWDRAQAKEMLGFGSKLLSIDLLNQLQMRGEEFMLAAIGGAASLGTWSVANRILKIIQETSSSVVSAVATPTFARLQDDKVRLFRGYGRSVALAGFALFPMTLLLAAVSTDLVPLLLGDQWQEAGQVAQIVAVSATLAAFNYFDRPIFVALDRLKTEVGLVVGSVISQLVLIVVFAPYGLVPLAWALLGRSLVLVPVRFVTLARTTGMPYRVQLPPLRILAAAGLAAGAAHLTDVGLGDLGAGPRVVLSLLVGAVIYPLGLWLCARSTTRQVVGELLELRRARGRRKSQEPGRRDAGLPDAAPEQVITLTDVEGPRPSLISVQDRPR